jgi:hypothetical protein
MKFMPLEKGKAAKSKKGFSKNVKTEMKAGKSQKQSLAIAYSEAGEKKKKMSKGKKRDCP